MNGRFVILLHRTPPGYERGDHWDVMFEDGQRLRTWAVTRPPTHGCAVTAERLADHRMLYLDFEGEISENRGVVSRWDAGTYRFHLPTTGWPTTGWPTTGWPATENCGSAADEHDSVTRLILCGRRLRGQLNVFNSGGDQCCKVTFRNW